jgi:hypothetical protein
MPTKTATSSIARSIRAQLLRIEGVVESAGVFTDGDAFWVNATEIAHFHDDDVIELRITKRAFSEHRERLKADPRIRRHSSSSDWIDVRFEKPADVAFVAELAELAAAAHRPGSGSPLKPPPTGAALERRRRFH